MKRLPAILVICLLFSAVIHAEEPDAAASGDYEYTLLESGGAEITKYTGNAEQLAVADELDGHPVTGIAKQAFAGCTGLGSIVLQETVTNIGDYAFEGCSSLAEITFPQSIAQVGNNPFAGCSKVRFVLPEKHPYLRSRDGVLFSNTPEARLISCPWWEGSYVVPEKTQRIGAYAFWGCRNMDEITIPDSVTAIGTCAFDSCTSLAEITIPDSVEEIGDNPFTRCGEIAIHVSEAHPFLEVADGALIAKKDRRLICFSAAESAAVVPDGTEVIGARAFYNCSSLESLTVPEGVTAIGKFAFYGCENLAGIVLPASVESIDETAFGKCTALTVTAPEGSYAAEYCEANGIALAEPDNFAAVCKAYTDSYSAAVPKANRLYRNYKTGSAEISAEDAALLEAFVTARAAFDALQTGEMTEEQAGCYAEALQMVDATEAGIILQAAEVIKSQK